jgi:hypothetical protein
VLALRALVDHRRGHAVLFGSIVAVATALAAHAPSPRPLRLEVGPFHAGFLRGPWSRPERAELEPAAAPDGRTGFLFRRQEGPSGFVLPVSAQTDPIRLTLRCSAPVRSAVGVFVAGEKLGELLVQPGVWDRYAIDVPRRLARGDGLRVDLAARPLALVRGEHVERGSLFLDYVEASAALGVGLSTRSVLLFASVPLGLLMAALAVGATPLAAMVVSLIAAAVAVVLVRMVSPLPFLLSIPRLIWPALMAGLVVGLALRRCRDVTPADRARLAALVTVAILFHGSLVFLPRFNPNDLEIQVHRTLDLALVPWDYDALLRYGSHLPTPTQPYGGADYALGRSVLVPYTPLPYFVFYGLHLLGLDLYWAMAMLTVVMAAAVAPWLWVVAHRIWDRGAAWIAILLYVLDLAVWHHVARCRAPAAFGGALGTAALVLLALRAGDMGSRRVVLRSALVVAAALLAYSSLPVLLGLFAAVLVVLLAIDARGLAPPARRGLAVCLALGGLIAGSLFYFHYLPGLLRGASGIEAAPDPVRVYTFFIFHNEGRPSLRLWYEGYWIGLGAGLAAAPWALRRATPTARPVLVSWLAAWGLVMLLKEPFLLPKLLRWAKEDQFLSPLLCLLIGAGIAALPRPVLRWSAAAVAVAAAAVVQARDFILHATNRLIL